ncbi:methylated-DNA--[protein]-cysteine S-methyltransferase [Aquibium oceanicum]|uniref:Cysteine methyltransferase n=1 Tax=Aquibium oceanicum TaxID=1670800 RepID=A0A1L3SSC6_9HYPH|nr:methylated-DNA--[protein]-cysteine S-methyltransferase [Aquibium oceanicum]APH72306.1 cysteine methyltransferase [Aquibium oceanicum]
MRPAAMGHHLVETRFGPVGIAWSEHGLTRLQLPGRDAAETERLLTMPRNGFHNAECRADAKVILEALLPPAMAQLAGSLKRYAAGERVDLRAVPVHLRGVGDFRKAIYREARTIGFGEVTTYGELAERAGHAGAARETGQAMGSNPCPLVIPCHRVLAAGRKPGGFSAPGGVSTKTRLLSLEGVRLGPDAPAQTSFGF